MAVGRFGVLNGSFIQYGMPLAPARKGPGPRQRLYYPPSRQFFSEVNKVNKSLLKLLSIVFAYSLLSSKKGAYS